MLTQCLSRLPKTLGSFAPCPPAANRAAWESLPRRFAGALLKRGEACLGKPFAAITAQDWLLFSQTGDRARFEAIYFGRRRQLNDLIMAECAEYQGRFLPDIVNGLWALCEESAWQLPAHNAYVRDAPQLPLPDAARPVLDLFACETGALLAVARFVLADALHGVSPLLPVRIDAELSRRIVQPYLSEHFWWMGNGGEPMCNWTSWCTQNVLLTLFCTPQTEQTRLAGLQKAAASLDCFLKDYGDDGCCNEGAQYYSHAGLTLWGALEILCAAALDAFMPLWRAPKIQNIAAYIFQMHVAGPYYVNFADCSPFAGRRGAREFLFAQRTGNAAMAAFCAGDWRASQKEPAPEGDIARINLFYLVTEAFAAAQLSAVPAPDLTETDSAKIAHTATARGEIYYPSVGVWIARDACFTLAVKAGGNGDSHNHNDTGSITLYQNGAPLLIDVGVETYTRKTFSPQRYEIWTMQSAWHNLPVFDGVQQCDGASFCASGIEVQFGAEESRIQMELAGAYPENAGVRSYRRTVTLEKGRCVRVSEECEGAYTRGVLSLMLADAPRIVNGALYAGGARITFSGAQEEPEIEAIPITDARLRLAWPDTIYRARIAFDRALHWTVEAEVE